MKKILEGSKVIVLSIVLSFAFSYVYASWSAPTANPPLENVEAPINIGAVEQTKQGGLKVAGGIASGGATPIPGDVCIMVSGHMKCLSDQPLNISLIASPAKITNGETSTLTWTTQGATSCTASGDWSGSKATGLGSESTTALTGPATYTYTLSCIGAGGSISTMSTSVIVSSPPAWVCPAGYTWTGLSLDCYSLVSPGTSNSMCYIPGTNNHKCVIGSAKIIETSAVSAPIWK